jgi:hypothetical protein
MEQMSSSTNIKAIVLRVNSDHRIRCSAAQEKKLVNEFDRLLETSELSKACVLQAVSQLPANFFVDNQLDSAAQYANLLWDALSIDAKELQAGHSTSITHFHGSVQTQILQTGAGSVARINQRSQQNQSYTETMQRALKDIREAIDVEIISEPDRKQAQQLLSDAERESSKTNPDQNRIRKTLTAIGKWTGERMTKAVDAAIGVGIKYGMTGHP